MEHKKLRGDGDLIHVLYHVGQPFLSIGTARVMLLSVFWYKNGRLHIGSEFWVIAGGLPRLKMFWNKYTCIHSCGLFTVILCRIQLILCMSYVTYLLKSRGAIPPACPPPPGSTAYVISLGSTKGHDSGINITSIPVFITRALCLLLYCGVEIMTS